LVIPGDEINAVKAIGRYLDLEEWQRLEYFSSQTNPQNFEHPNAKHSGDFLNVQDLKVDLNFEVCSRDALNLTDHTRQAEEASRARRPRTTCKPLHFKSLAQTLAAAIRS
jgi:hypothetical protein